MKFRNITLLFIISLVILVLVGSVSAGGCCLLPYDDGLNSPYYFDNFINSNAECSQVLPGSIWIEEDCYEGPVSSPTAILVDNFQTGCCCNDLTNSANNFGGDETNIYNFYCEALSDHTFVQSSGGSCYCGSPVSTEEFYEINGTVTDSLGNKLEGIHIQYMETGIPVIETSSTSNGFYSLSNIPSGIVSIRATTPTNHELSCIISDKSLTLNSDQEGVDFVLSCENNQQACTPDWNVGSWGDCVPYTVGGSTILVRFRDVIDNNNCGTTINQPTNVNKTSCEGSVSFGDCGNFELDGYEQCDNDKFRDTLDFEKEINSVLCDDFPAFQANGQSVGCTPVCTYDTSLCSPVCDGVCDRISECGVCSECNGNTEVCGDPCEEMKPDFLNDIEDKSMRNIFDLYEFQYLQEENSYSTINYFEGTNDVELQWDFNASCLANILGYKVKVCKEGITGRCGSEEEFVEFIPNLGTKSFRFENVLEENEVYCYNVAAVSLDGAKENWAYNASSDLPCFATGNDYCMEPSHEKGLNCVSLNGEASRPMGCVKDSPSALAGKTNLSLLEADCLGTTIQDPSLAICVETEVNPAKGLYGAECRQKSECVLCNGLFGLYSAHNLQSFFFRDDGQLEETTCESFLFKGSSQSNPADQSGLCYKDNSGSFGDKYDTCEKVDSCYDYKSSSACENDYCYKFTNESGNNCEWNTYDEELGIGVCKPTIETEEDCFRCDSDSPLGFCEENICGLYGDCYFKDIENHDSTGEEQRIQTENENIYHSPYTSTCIHKNDMACYFYNDKEDCLGSNNNSVNINVSRENIFGAISLRNSLYGDNSQIGFSEDVFAFGDCFWNNDSNSEYYGCNKNSDNYYDSSLFSVTPANQDYKLDDCENSYFNQFTTNDVLRCFQDNESPETNIILREKVQQTQYLSETGGYLPVYGRNQLINLSYSTNDSLSSSDEIASYFSFTSVNNCSGCLPFVDCDNCADPQHQTDCYVNGCELYPQHLLDEFDPLGVNSETNNLKHGENIMTYFSEDSSHNLEKIRYERIFIDVLAPEFSQAFSYDLKTFLLDIEDVYASNLSIEFSLTEPALCQGNLLLGSKYHPVGDFRFHGENFKTFYPWLPDGQYSFKLVCEDDYQNRLIEEYEIIIEGDKSITNPQPRGGVFNHIDEVELSIETPYDADCRLSKSRTPYSVSQYELSSKKQLSNGNWEHKIDFTDAQFGASDISGTHIFFASCDFGAGKVTEMKNGDTISFTIDQESPNTIIYATSDEGGNDYQVYNEASANWQSSRSIQMLCNDTTVLTALDNFGCANIHYCLGNPVTTGNFTPSVDCIPDISGSRYMKSSSGIVDLQNLGADIYTGAQLYFYAEDKGGNTEQLRRVNIRVRDVNFQEPLFNWLN